MPRSSPRRRWRYRDRTLLRLPCWHFKLGREGQPRTDGKLVWAGAHSSEPRGSVRWRVRDQGEVRNVALGYRAEGKPVVQSLTMTADIVAGTTRRRWWWSCPRCERRCGVLYFLPSPCWFVCRLCGSVTYSSRQRVHPARREVALMRKVERTLGL